MGIPGQATQQLAPDGSRASIASNLMTIEEGSPGQGEVTNVDDETSSHVGSLSSPKSKDPPSVGRQSILSSGRTESLRSAREERQRQSIVEKTMAENAKILQTCSCGSTFGNQGRCPRCMAPRPSLSASSLGTNNRRASGLAMSHSASTISNGTGPGGRRALQELITAIYVSKKDHNLRCDRLGQPRQTMAEHLESYLHQRHGRHPATVARRLRSISESIDRFAPVDADVLVFAKIIDNCLDEGAADIQEVLRQTVKKLLISRFAFRNPDIQAVNLESTWRNQANGSGVLFEDCEDVVRHLYDESDAEELLSRLQQNLAYSPSAVPSFVGDSASNNSSGGWVSSGPSTPVRYQAFLELLLRYQADLREEHTQSFRVAFSKSWDFAASATSPSWPSNIPGALPTPSSGSGSFAAVGYGGTAASQMAPLPGGTTLRRGALPVAAVRALLEELTAGDREAQSSVLAKLRGHARCAYTFSQLVELFSDQLDNLGRVRRAPFAEKTAFSQAPGSMEKRSSQSQAKRGTVDLRDYFPSEVAGVYASALESAVKRRSFVQVTKAKAAQARRSSVAFTAAAAAVAAEMENTRNENESVNSNTSSTGKILTGKASIDLTTLEGDPSSPRFGGDNGKEEDEDPESDILDELSSVQGPTLETVPE